MEMYMNLYVCLRVDIWIHASTVPSITRLIYFIFTLATPFHASTAASAYSLA